jgi:hypothetical protein
MERHGLRWAAAGLIAGSLAGCAAQPPAAATYAKPTESEATAAYARALRADFLDWQPTEQDFAATGMPPQVRQAYANMHDEVGERDIATKSLASLEAATPGACQWQPLKQANVNWRSRRRVAGVAAGYYCDVNVVHRNPGAGRVSAPAVGYFYKDQSGEFTFAGEIAHGFKPTA